jgi:multiple sugar transport system permease protein
MTPTPTDTTTTSAPGAARARRAGWLMVSPAMLLMGLFLIVPFALAFAMSFTNQRLVSPNPTQFVGLENYRQMLGLGVLVLDPERDAQGGAIVREGDGSPSYPSLRGYTRDNPDYPQLDRKREWFHLDGAGDSRLYVLASDVIFMKALVNTMLFVVVVAPVQALLALLLAMLINQPLRGINVFRTIYFMPVVISMVVVAFLWRFIYAGDNGLLNSLLQQLTFDAFKPIDWLGQPSTALWAIMAMSIWQGVGFHMIVWLSGLQTISASLYEAAALEGASKWQVFRYVTWPGLRNTAILVMVVITMQAFTLYPQIDVMTRGGPLDSTQSLVFQAVQRGYGKQDIAGGSTISVFLFLFVLAISLGQRWLTREKKPASGH